MLAASVETLPRSPPRCTDVVLASNSPDEKRYVAVAPEDTRLGFERLGGGGQRATVTSFEAPVRE